MQFHFEMRFLKAISFEIGYRRSIFIFFVVIDSFVVIELYNRIHVRSRSTCSIMIFIPIPKNSMKYFFLSLLSVIFCSLLVRQQLTNATSTENIIVFIFDHWSETLETGLCSLSLRRLDLNSRGTRVISYTTSSSNQSTTRKSLFSLLRKISRFILRTVSRKESVRNYSIQCILFLY